MDGHKGVSLIEVLMALLVFSIGILGLATMSVVAVQANRAAAVRTQVGFLAGGMIERMRANPIGVWRGLYNHDDYPTGGIHKACGATESCSPGDVVRRDREMWSKALRTHLPGVARTSIRCDNGSAGYAPGADELSRRPPYGGHCRMIVRWTEHGLADGDDRLADDSLRSLTWMFQP
jgi:type IV pilus assembly protein PilV